MGHGKNDHEPIVGGNAERSAYYPAKMVELIHQALDKRLLKRKQESKGSRATKTGTNCLVQGDPKPNDETETSPAVSESGDSSADEVDITPTLDEDDIEGNRVELDTPFSLTRLGCGLLNMPAFTSKLAVKDGRPQAIPKMDPRATRVG